MFVPRWSSNSPVHHIINSANFIVHFSLLTELEYDIGIDELDRGPNTPLLSTHLR